MSTANGKEIFFTTKTDTQFFFANIFIISLLLNYSLLPSKKLKNLQLFAEVCTLIRVHCYICVFLLIKSNVFFTFVVQINNNYKICQRYLKYAEV